MSAYPNFGKVKTIVIPVPIEQLNINEYKEKYGIDLRDFVLLDKQYGRMYLKPNAFYLIDFNTAVGSSLIGEESANFAGLFPISKLNASAYVSGNVDAKLRIETPAEDFYLEIGIPNTLEFSYDNLYIFFNEI